jgi:hypothetical protein
MARNDPSPVRTSVQGVFYRYANYDVPFWVRANTQPGRWHVPGDGPTQYLAQTTDAAWADLIRSENLRTAQELSMVHTTLWQARIDQANVVDYRDFKRADEAGFPPDALVDDDLSRCQQEGRRIRAQGYLGILAPSAALPGHVTLTLFGPRLAVRWDAPPSLAIAIPTSALTTGAPPAALLQDVRYPGEPHSELLAYKRDARQQVPRRRARSRGRKRSNGGAS